MSLSFANLSHAYGNTPVLHGLSLKLNPNEITCLLGPSGSGKSTLLRLAAGLESVQSGRIELGGKVLASAEFNPPPEQRSVGLMFQDNALFPNMSVADNIGFGLTEVNASKRRQRIDELLAMIGLQAYAKRLPHQLSGGQQQRVTLARALAAKPQVLLMDEPYASIDVTLRRSLREAARQTLKSSQTTSVLVTHDPHEAMEMADVIAVLDHGRIMQTGTPRELFERPASVEVAKLFGAAQTLKAQPDQGGIRTSYGKITIEPDRCSDLDNICCAVVRPEGLRVARDKNSNLRVRDLRFIGDAWLAYLLPEDTSAAMEPLRVLTQHPTSLQLGDPVSVSANTAGFYTFNKGHEIDESI